MPRESHVQCNLSASILTLTDGKQTQPQKSPSYAMRSQYSLDTTGSRILRGLKISQ